MILRSTTKRSKGVAVEPNTRVYISPLASIGMSTSLRLPTGQALAERSAIKLATACQRWSDAPGKSQVTSSQLVSLRGTPLIPKAYRRLTKPLVLATFFKFHLP